MLKREVQYAGRTNTTYFAKFEKVDKAPKDYFLSFGEVSDNGTLLNFYRYKDNYLDEDEEIKSVYTEEPYEFEA